MVKRRFHVVPAQCFLWLSMQALAVRAAGETKLILDDMSQYFDGKDYSADRYQELVDCLNRWGDQGLVEAQDAAWKAFYDYYLSADTTWGTFNSSYLETKLNKTALFGSGLRTYEVQEKCNFASNVAYYRSAIRVCDYPDWGIPEDYQDALMKTFATLAAGSGWFHGSVTEIGRQFDGWLVAITVNNAYQIAIRSIETSSRILLTVSDDLEPTPITELANNVAYMAINKDVSEWVDFLREQQVVRGYTKTAVALAAFSCSALAPFFLCECLIGTLAPQLLNEDETEFFTNQYLPELKELAKTESFPISLFRGTPLLVKLLGVLVGLLWAFAFQEDTIPTPCLEGTIFNTTLLGALKSPLVDFVAKQLTQVDNTDPTGLFAEKPYPGAKFCNRDSPHALWHQLGADSLVELYAVADEVDQTLQKRKKASRRLRGDITVMAHQVT